MRRRIWGTLLWVLLVPIVGAGLLLWTLLQLLGSFRPKTMLTLGGLAVALSAPNPVTSQLSEAVWPVGHMLLSSGLVVLGAVVLSLGASSQVMRRLWWRVQHCGDPRATSSS